MNTGIIFGLTAMMVWGVMDFLSVSICRELGDYKILFWTQFLGFILLIGAYFFFGHPIPINQFFWILAVAGIFDTVGYFYFYRGLTKGLVSIVSPISSMWAAVTLVIGVVFLQEKLIGFQGLALLFVIAGCLLVSGDLRDFFKPGAKKLEEGVKEGIITMLAWGSMAAFIASTVQAFGWFMPIIIMRIFVVIPLFAFINIKKIDYKLGARKNAIPFLFLISALDIAGFVFFNLGVTNYPAALVAPIAAAYPLVTVVLAYIFYKERMVLNQYLGVLGIITGIVLLSL